MSGVKAKALQRREFKEFGVLVWEIRDGGFNFLRVWSCGV